MGSGPYDPKQFWLDAKCIIIPRNSAQQLKEEWDRVLLTLNSFGWILNVQKSQLHPSQTMEYLGVILSTSSQLRTARSCKGYLPPQFW